MRQVFLFTSPEKPVFENEDGFPVSEKLWPALEARFAEFRTVDSSVLRIPAASAQDFLTDFYSRYELSQPQRRILRRLEQILSGLPAGGTAGFAAAEVSEHRSRRAGKKN